LTFDYRMYTLDGGDFKDQIPDLETPISKKTNWVGKTFHFDLFSSPSPHGRGDFEITLKVPPPVREGAQVHNLKVLQITNS